MLHETDPLAARRTTTTVLVLFRSDFCISIRDSGELDVSLPPDAAGTYDPGW